MKTIAKKIVNSSHSSSKEIHQKLFISLEEVAAIIGTSKESYRQTIAKYTGHPQPFKRRPTIYRRQEILDFLGCVDPAKV